jgi:hypothetical protein
MEPQAGRRIKLLGRKPKKRPLWTAWLRAVVIEDMDISPREWDSSLTAEEEERLAEWDVTRGACGRAFQTWEGACHTIKPKQI